ncbi:dynein intermediate chain 2, ciliary-like [Penaeus japonicus]|uniref:dynein intermediate chain 2, ciliary-like n=1 Tax=Penaeus japonicus TaxID=27405 RepID=UPI001C70BFE3|nr:dynein intermediate chain 2, ciliary-like [Penaeus japonicus]
MAITRQRVREKEVDIKLSASGKGNPAQVLFDFRSGAFKPDPKQDVVFDLLSLPSRIVHKEDLEKEDKKKETVLIHGEKKGEGETKESSANAKEMEELYGSHMTPEELAKLDAQPNPFNYSDRVSQTFRVVVKDLAIQTDPPPGTTFSANVGFSDIYDAYEKDYVRILAKRREEEMKREKEKERERERKAGKSSQKASRPTSEEVGKKQAPPLPATAAARAEAEGAAQEGPLPLMRTVVTLERMVSQNIFDEVTQDYKYWEDSSDEYRNLEGSLLPLWRFPCEGARALVVTDICWSPVYHDLFAAAYTSENVSGASDARGMLCLFTLKNPGIPERVLQPPCGVTSVQFHPTRASVLAAGRVDGAVMVIDVCSPRSSKVITSTVVSGSHLQPVCQVRWVPTDPGESLCFYSVSEDGRVSEWLVRPSTLVHADILDFLACAENSKKAKEAKRFILEGRATCIALNPNDKTDMLVGVDTGEVLQLRTSSTHALTRYHAHTGTVRTIAWNAHHDKVFASCSLDWTLKIWIRDSLSPLVTLDLGGPVASVSWSPYSSSVVAAATDEGRVHVYDLFLRKCQPLCSQNLNQRRRLGLSCVAFNPFSPIVLAGGEKGYLMTLKLSPNLRRPYRDAKGAEEMRQSEIELCKMERIIATSKEWEGPGEGKMRSSVVC